MRLREHPKYIFMRHFMIFKQVILDEGYRWVSQGVIKQAEDVFYLSLDEILAVVENCFIGDLSMLIESRKEEFRRYKNFSMALR